MQVDNKIIVKFPRYVAVLFLNEIQDMLAQNKELWEKAIRRGKSESRFQKEQGRRPKGGVEHE